MIFDEFYDNQDEESEEDLEIQFPVDVTLEDGTIITLNDEDELDELIEECE